MSFGAGRDDFFFFISFLSIMKAMASSTFLCPMGTIIAAAADSITGKSSPHTQERQGEGFHQAQFARFYGRITLCEASAPPSHPSPPAWQRLRWMEAFNFCLRHLLLLSHPPRGLSSNSFTATPCRTRFNTFTRTRRRGPRYCRQSRSGRASSPPPPFLTLQRMSLMGVWGPLPPPPFNPLLLHQCPAARL